MEQSKSPKALAYANLGKRQAAKNPSEQLRKPKRDSTGIYEELLDQIPQEANSYIRDLVKQNEKQSNEAQANHNNHARRKSYAEIVIDSSSKEKEKERVREERETLGKSKFALLQNTFLGQVTPKNSTLPLNKRSNKNGNSMSSLSQSANVMVNSFKKQPVKASDSFLDHLSNYLYELNETHQSHANTNFNGTEKLSETLKINSGQNQSFKLISKLDQSHLKIKELKLKNYYQQKQINKFSKKEQKMIGSLREMYAEIKHLNAQLSYQKQQRKKLERIIDNFQMRRNQPQRKTIGKHHINIQRLNDMHTEYQHENDFDSSFRDNRKNSTNKRGNAIKIYDEARTRGIQGMLDSEKIEKLFRSNFNSDESDD